MPTIRELIDAVRQYARQGAEVGGWYLVESLADYEIALLVEKCPTVLAAIIAVGNEVSTINDRLDSDGFIVASDDEEETRTDEEMMRAAVIGTDRLYW